MSSLLSHTRQSALLRHSVALISPQLDELASRSYARFMEIAPDVGTQSAYRSVRQMNKLLIAALIDGRIAARIEQVFAESDLRARHLAIMTNAILTTAGEMLNDDWTVEIETVWDEALHNLVVQVIRMRSAVRR